LFQGCKCANDQKFVVLRQDRHGVLDLYLQVHLPRSKDLDTLKFEEFMSRITTAFYRWHDHRRNLSLTTLPERRAALY